MGELDFKDFLKHPKSYYLAAISIREETLAKHPNYKGGWSAKGVACLGVNDYAEAIKCFNIALEIDSRYTDALCYKGKTFIKLHYFEDAIRCYDRILQIEPASSEAWNNKGCCLARLERYEEAMSCLKKGIEIDPDCAGFYYNKACIESLRCKAHQSLGYLKQAIDLNKKYYPLAEVDPDLEFIWHHKEFKNLKRRNEHSTLPI